MAAELGSGHRCSDQLVGGEGYEEVATLMGAGGQPVTVSALGKDQHHALFLARLVVVAEKRILRGVDAEQCEAFLPVPTSFPVTSSPLGGYFRGLSSSALKVVEAGLHRVTIEVQIRVN